MTAVFRCFQQHFHKFLPVGAAADDIHTKGADSLGVVLAVTAADGDDRFRMGFPATADDGTVLLVRHGGDGASVDDVTVAIVLKMADPMALFRQKPLHRLRFVLICFASKGIKSKVHCQFHQIRRDGFVIIVQTHN